jgi:hypothetical protein
VGVDFDDVTARLEREGLAKFEQSWHELSHTIAAELHRNHPASNPDPGPAADRIPSSAGRVNESLGPPCVPSPEVRGVISARALAARHAELSLAVRPEPESRSSCATTT